MTASAPPKSALPSALRRFWWVILLVTGLTTAGAMWASQFAPATEYTAEAAYIVPVATGLEVAPTTLPNSAFNAQGLARTYAAVLEADAALVGALATQSGMTPGELKAGMTAGAVESTPVINVSFTSTDEARTLAFFPVLTNVLAQGVTPNIPAGNLVLLQSPQSTDSAGSLAPYPVLGVVAGLLLGLGAALLLERLDARVRGAADLRRMTGHPVLDLTGGHKETAEGVLALRALRLARHVGEVAVVGVDAKSALAAPPLAVRLAQANDRLVAQSSDDEPVSRARWAASGVLTGGSPAELAVQRTDATVVVTSVGSRMKAAEDALIQLDLLGVSAVAVAVVPRSSRRALVRAATPPQAAAPASDEDDRQPVRDLAARP